ncbi:MAG: Ig-like domain-containing protein [Bacteroidales bacterium]|nr:Ig-like domain-containing protein [Bacteroidales bacterium]
MKRFLLFILILSFHSLVSSQKIHLTETFDEIDFPSQGWTIEDPASPAAPRWHFSYSIEAQGQYQELKFTNGGIQGFRYISPQINTEGYNNLHIKFNQLMVTDYAGGEVHIQSRSNNGEWNTIWSQDNNDFINNTNADIVNFEVSGSDIGSENFQFCFFVNSPDFSIKSWYIDNIVLYSNLEDDLCLKTVINNNHCIDEEPLSPTVFLYNNGENMVANTTVKATIKDPYDQELYSETLIIQELLSNDELEISFNSFIFPEENSMYYLEFTIPNYNDQNIENNSIGKYIDNYKNGRQDILKEIITGDWCQYCPTAAHAIEQMESDGIYNMAIVEYHYDDDFESTSSLGRIDNYYNEVLYPTSITNGETYGGVNYTAQVDQYNQHAAYGSALHLILSGTQLSENAYSISVNTLKNNPFFDDYTILHFALTETDIPHEWGDNEEYMNHVNRMMFPDYNGTRIDLINETENRQTYQVNLEPDWVQENCRVIAFIQNRLTREVYQAKTILFNELPEQSPNITFNPISGSSNIPTNHEFILNADRPIRNIDNSEITNNNLYEIISFTNSSGSSVEFTANINDSKTIITLSSDEALEYDTQYTIRISGIENYSDIPGVTQQTTFITQEEFAPPFVTFSPENNAELVSINTAIEIRFSQSIRNLDDSPINNNDIPNLVNLTQNENQIPFFGTINLENNKITILPTQPFLINKTYTINLHNVENDYDLSIEPQSSVFTTGCLAIETNTNSSVLLYPNPVKEKLVVHMKNIDSTPKEIIFTNINGYSVKSTTSSIRINDNNFILDTSELDAGLWIIQFIYEKQIITNKILKL